MIGHIKQTKARANLTIDPDILASFDLICEDIGHSRSALVEGFMAKTVQEVTGQAPTKGLAFRKRQNRLTKLLTKEHEKRRIALDQSDDWNFD